MSFFLLLLFASMPAPSDDERQETKFQTTSVGEHDLSESGINGSINSELYALYFRGPGTVSCAFRFRLLY